MINIFNNNRSCCCEGETNTAYYNAIAKIEKYKERYGTNYYPCNCNLLGNVFLVASDASATVIPVDGVIPFSIINRSSGITVTAPGTINIPRAGTYTVNWTVNATNTSDDAQVLTTSLNTVTPTETVVATASTPTTIAPGETGTITGSAIVVATEATTLEITNTGADEFTLNPVNGVSARVAVTQIN